MSMSKIGKLENDSESIIVRGYADEPVNLVAVHVRPGVIEAIETDKSLSMGFPAKDVFRFDNGVFRQLRDAYERGDRQTLQRLWQQAEKYRP